MPRASNKQPHQKRYQNGKHQEFRNTYPKHGHTIQAAHRLPMPMTQDRCLAGLGLGAKPRTRRARGHASSSPWMTSSGSASRCQGAFLAIGWGEPADRHERMCQVVRKPNGIRNPPGRTSTERADVPLTEPLSALTGSGIDNLRHQSAPYPVPRKLDLRDATRLHAEFGGPD